MMLECFLHPHTVFTGSLGCPERFLNMICAWPGLEPNVLSYSSTGAKCLGKVKIK